MSYKFFLFITVLLSGMILYYHPPAQAEEQRSLVPDKALCVKMLRFGKEAYTRGKYLDAKEYFRKAVQADPASDLAWRYYDLATLFALAEKVEQNAKLIAPGQSARQEVSPAGQAAPPPPPPAPSEKKPEKEIKFKIVDDEGC
ncbi:MAG: hypothetical protein ABIG67_02945 [Pseudomonadota bacterium]